MSKIKIDYSKLLGFRLVAADLAATGVSGAKIGEKGGVKVGTKTDTRVIASE